MDVARHDCTLVFMRFYGELKLWKETFWNPHAAEASDKFAIHLTPMLARNGADNPATDMLVPATRFIRERIVQCYKSIMRNIQGRKTGNVKIEPGRGGEPADIVGFDQHDVHLL